MSNLALADIEPGGAIFSWLIPFCADILNKFRVGVDGRTAYERITAHKCNVAQIGFCEVVDFKVETDKHNRLKADSEFSEGFCSWLRLEIYRIFGCIR